MIILPAKEPWPDDAFLAKIAAEFNYAETAYIRETESGSSNEYDLRWFTPVKEARYKSGFLVSDMCRLCGHATLASAYILKTHPDVLTQPLSGNIVFHTLSGELIVDVSSDNGIISMDFPVDSSSEVQPKPDKQQVADAIGSPVDKLVNIEASKDLKYAVIEVESSVNIASLNVDTLALVDLFSLLLKLTIGSIIS